MKVCYGRRKRGRRHIGQPALPCLLTVMFWLGGLSLLTRQLRIFILPPSAHAAFRDPCVASPIWPQPVQSSMTEPNDIFALDTTDLAGHLHPSSNCKGP